MIRNKVGEDHNTKVVMAATSTQVFDHLWSWRWILLAFLAISVIGGYAATTLIQSEVSRSFYLVVFGEGTPTDTRASLEEQLRGYLSRRAYVVFREKEGGLRVPLSQEEDKAAAEAAALTLTVDEFVKLIDSKVAKVRATLESAAAPKALESEQLVAFESYRNGRETGLINPVTTRVDDGKKRGRSVALAASAALTIFAFGLLSTVLLSQIGRWRRSRFAVDA